MSIVSWMVGTADGFLADAAESQFGAVASNTGTIVLLMVTLSLIGVCINMAFQFRSMHGASFFWYLVKLTLIGLFAFNWANFNAVSNAVTGGLDYVAGALISSVGGGGAGATYFAGEFDRLITEFSQYLNAIGNNLNWMTGAILGGIGLVLLSLLGFMTGIILIFAKMMLTLMLGLAPIMIALSLFDATKESHCHRRHVLDRCRHGEFANGPAWRSELGHQHRLARSVLRDGFPGQGLCRCNAPDRAGHLGEPDGGCGTCDRQRICRGAARDREHRGCAGQGADRGAHDR